ncbi:hypothetical protein KM043_002765 [Ampulex compressa]|nr:hypothetical protein KM043_002765 [Ampulex compressa]
MSFDGEEEEQRDEENPAGIPPCAAAVRPARRRNKEPRPISVTLFRVALALAFARPEPPSCGSSKRLVDPTIEGSPRLISTGERLEVTGSSMPMAKRSKKPSEILEVGSSRYGRTFPIGDLVRSRRPGLPTNSRPV